MTKTEALRLARAQLAHGYYRLSAVSVEVRCPLDRNHRVTRDVRAWATSSQRVAALRVGLTEHLLDQEEHPRPLACYACGATVPDWAVRCPGCSNVVRCGVPGCRAVMAEEKCPNFKAYCLGHCGEGDH